MNIFFFLVKYQIEKKISEQRYFFQSIGDQLKKYIQCEDLINKICECFYFRRIKVLLVAKLVGVYASSSPPTESRASKRMQYFLQEEEGCGMQGFLWQRWSC